VRDIWAKQNQIARTVISDAIPYQSLASAFHDQRKLIFRMVVPVEGEAGIIAHIGTKRRRSGHELLKVRLHVRSVRLDWQIFKDLSRAGVNSVPIVVNLREDTDETHGYSCERSRGKAGSGPMRKPFRSWTHVTRQKLAAFAGNVPRLL
jgi:hypothetical protein